MTENWEAAEYQKLLAERDRLKAINAELLAAVEWLIDQVAEPINPDSEWGRRHAQARAAIAKATGETP